MRYLAQPWPGESKSVSLFDLGAMDIYPLASDMNLVYRFPNFIWQEDEMTKDWVKGEEHTMESYVWEDIVEEYIA